MTRYIFHLRPQGRARSAWLEVTEPETGPVSYVLHECGDGFSHSRPLSVAEVLSLSARMGVG